MKTTRQLFVMLFVMVGVASHAYAQSWLTNGLVAYYPFNGNANDESGNGNNGTPTAAIPTADRFGATNRAYAFDGVSSLITVPDSASLRISNDITVTCWVQFAGTNMNVRLLGKGIQCGKNYGLFYASWAPYWMFQQFPPEGGCIGCQENTASSTPGIIPGKWYQMVGVRTGGFSQLYVDGIFLEDVDHPENCSPTTYTGSESLLVGGTDPSELPTVPPLTRMHGSLDDIRIYNRALSSNEVVTLFALESGPRVDLVKAVKPILSNLFLGTNYQLQLSGDLLTWTNHGTPFTATNNSMVYTQYWDVDNWDKLFFRLQTSP